MKRLIEFTAVAICCISFSGCKSETLQTVLNEGSSMLLNGQNADPSKREIGLGLKEALSVSIEKGAGVLAAPNGFLKNEAVKILLPPELRKVQSTLQKIGLGSLSDELTVRLNRAAEDAALKSVPIFKKAILGMSFRDVMSVLTGPENAATNYLKGATSNEIIKAFTPQISQSLNKVGAAKLWSEIFTRYNSIPFTKKINANLVDYTSQRALGGLFLTVAQREAKIRESVSYRGSPLLKKVFSFADRLKSN